MKRVRHFDTEIPSISHFIPSVRRENSPEREKDNEEEEGGEEGDEEDKGERGEGESDVREVK